MYQMSATVEIPITTLADGTALVTINPNGAAYSQWVLSSNVIPFASLSAGSSTLPFATTPQVNNPGPFAGQAGNTSRYAVDTCCVSYIHTESLYNAKGKI